MSNHLFLADSSIWICLSRPAAPSRLVARVAELIAANVVAFDLIVCLEVLVGSRDDGEFARNEEDFQGLIELPVLTSTWNSSARLGFDLRRKGVSVSIPDLLIAGSAIEHSAVLIHADSDFDRIAANSDLLVESYAAI